MLQAETYYGTETINFSDKLLLPEENFAQLSEAEIKKLEVWECQIF